MIITEGISGYWHYHISDDATPNVALCGARTMQTNMPLSDWGMPGGEHLPKRYTFCKECDKLMKEKP